MRTPKGCVYEEYIATETLPDAPEDAPTLAVLSSAPPILNEPNDYDQNPNRLSNVRWPLGEEPYPDVEGTHKDSPWVNVKLDVTENPPEDPNQRHLLRGGPELRMPCALCGEPLHIGAERTAREVLIDGGFVFKPGQKVANLDAGVAACVCKNGHVTQLRAAFARRLIKD